MAQELTFTSRSSNVSEVRFESDSDEPDADNIGQLFVTFKKGGATYRYDDVPMSIFIAMQDMEEIGSSCGQFFHANVRNVFACERVAG